MAQEKQRLRTQYSICEDEDSIPGVSQWVKDTVLLKVTDVAQIWCCCGYGCKKKKKKKAPIYHSIIKCAHYYKVF